MFLISRQTQYLLKWKGYDASHNTWAVKESFDCDKLLTDFENEASSNRKRVRLDDKVQLKPQPKKVKLDSNNNAISN